MAAENPNRDEAARAYQAEMARVFGVPADGPPPRMDVVLLGLGSDAHTASLFPNSAALGELARWVVPADGPANGVPRLTLTAATINRAACVIFVVTGHSKARAVAAVLEGAADSERLPAQLIEPEEGAVLWLLDAGAAGGLRSATRVAAEVSTGPSR
jgi:6-phosphogluconolactonase